MVSTQTESDGISVVRSLIPYDIDNYSKIRLGKDNDGGYVVYKELIQDIDSLVTCGTGGDISFVYDFIARNKSCSVRLYDDKEHPSVFSRLPKDRSRYEQTCLGSGRSLTSVISGLIHICLTVDIEGAEYDAFYNDDGSFVDLSNCDMLVFELHDLDVRRNEAARLLAEIQRYMTLFHIHGNSFCGSVTLSGYSVPRLVELSFVNNRLARNKTVSSSDYPIRGLDQSNARNRSDIQLVFLRDARRLIDTAPVSALSCSTERLTTEWILERSVVITNGYSTYVRFCTRFREAGFDRIPADLSGDVPPCLIENNHHGPATMTHYTAVRMAKTLGWDHVTVFEYDAYPRKGCRHILDDILSRGDVPKDAEALLLGNLNYIREYTCGGRDESAVGGVGETESWGPIRNPFWGTHAVVYMQRGFDKYLSRMNEIPAAEKCVCDQWWKLLDHVYASKLNLFLQAHDKLSYPDWIYDKENLSEFPDISI